MRARVAASVVLAIAVAAAGTAGCTLLRPAGHARSTTTPSDGVSANVGDVNVRNALIADRGRRATATSSSPSSTTATTTQSVQLPVRGHRRQKVRRKVDVGVATPDEPRASAATATTRSCSTGIDAKPGASSRVTCSTATRPGKQLLVPVLDGTPAEYADLLPDAASPTPERPTPTPTPRRTPSACRAHASKR